MNITSISILLCIIFTSCANESLDNIEFRLTEQYVIDGSSCDTLVFTPMDLAIDSESRVFILDSYADKVFVFNNNGEYLFEFGENGPGPGEFQDLSNRFHIDKDNHVYLIDGGEIEVFTTQGEYIGEILTDEYSIFDIAAYDTNSIYINTSFPVPNSDIPIIRQININGDVINEFGIIYPDVSSMEPWIQDAYRSCILAVDRDGSLYYTSAMDYRIYKYNKDGDLLYSIECQSQYEPQFDNHNITPVIWDLCVEDDKIFVLWAQGSSELGYRIDVFRKDTGELLGHFFSGAPSEIHNMCIIIKDMIFYVGDYYNDNVYVFRLETDVTTI
ncbi:MAG: 6-bladed beta-propeller [Candidatus Aegiribacteria sp.]|nr:6-bladed beta-propeller [Candidatus Aegiribacteria sp.]